MIRGQGRADKKENDDDGVRYPKTHSAGCLAHIKKCKKLGVTKLLCDGGGLYLRATSTGAASWLFRYEIDDIGHEHGLGSFYTYNLDEAREKARKCRQLRHEGLDPIAESQKARQTRRNVKAGGPASRTFKYCALKFIAFKEVGWRNDKHRRDWENSLERLVFPLLGNRPVSTITLEDVLAVLTPHWETTTETAMRVRGRIEAILGWAGAQKPPLRSGANPATSAWQSRRSSECQGPQGDQAFRVAWLREDPAARRRSTGPTGRRWRCSTIHPANRRTLEGDTAGAME
jgi:hypothetical protein